ncbi:hypothetical protein PVAP13_6NG111400 [Panicum virgatum]|uniref:Chaperonin-like RbcX protein n=1 Tax=Panicum virgatum TaxID=38727 RepID=A0A8T0QZX7_PANVG|nr:hypothetical protein PVAP13_6NG111400 [Panicum virgatum]
MGRTTPRISHETGLVQVVYVLLTQFGRAVLGNGYSGFGEGSPERKAATNLQHFFNYVAVRVVLAQLESYNREAYYELKEFVSRTSLNDAEIFCKKLIRESPRLKGLAMRILEVRSAYVKRDFEWDNLKKLSFKMVDDSNTKLMRDYVLEVSHIEDENHNIK